MRPVGRHRLGRNKPRLSNRERTHDAERGVTSGNQCRTRYPTRTGDSTGRGSSDSRESAARKGKEMNEYYECTNCGQVVQGFEASQQIECCDNPNYVPVEKDNGDKEDD